MSLLRRSIRNLIRSPLHTALIVGVLGVSTGLVLIMLIVNGATVNQLDSIKGEIGTQITVRPAGSYGATGTPLDEENVDKLLEIPHIVSIEKTLLTPYTGDNLQSAIVHDMGSRKFTMPITAMGVDPAVENPVLLNSARIEVITEGRYLTIAESEADVAVIGQALAEKNSLNAGAQVNIEGVPVEIVGIFSSGQLFGDNMLIMPISTVQRVFNLEGVNSVAVEVDNVENADGVVGAIRETLGKDTIDIVTSKDMFEQIGASLVNASETSQTGMIAAFVAAAVVIMFSVALMVRQRVKEIGILKAIGASSWQVGLQFSIENLFISIVAAIIGALITFPLAQSVADMLVTGSAGPGGGISHEAMHGGGGLVGGGVTSIAGVNVAVSPDIFLYALVMAVALIVAASIFPTWYISRVKPGEVLRYE